MGGGSLGRRIKLGEHTTRLGSGSGRSRGGVIVFTRRGVWHKGNRTHMEEGTERTSPGKPIAAQRKRAWGGGCGLLRISENLKPLRLDRLAEKKIKVRKALPGVSIRPDGTGSKTTFSGGGVRREYGRSPGQGEWTPRAGVPSDLS